MTSDEHLSAIAQISNIDFTIAAQDTVPESSNVTVRKRGDVFHIQMSLLGQTERRLNRAWQTGLALDTSASMRAEYGRRVIGSIPYKFYADYQNKGWVSSESRDGRRTKCLQRPAVTDALDRGLIRLSPNTLDFVAPELITYLASNMACDGSTHLTYWGGGNGSEVETVGDIKANEAARLTIDGPDRMMFGDKSLLLPAIKYYTDHFKKSPLSLVVFVTDGRIDDLSEVKRYTTQLADEMSSNQRPPLRFILVGVGEDVDELTLKQLSAHNTDSYLNVWDYMIVSDLQDVLKIFAEVMRDSQIVAASGSILDSSANQVRLYPRGLPSRIGFSLPANSPWFDLVMPNQTLRQYIKIPTYMLRG